jgi:hypothetical protein
MSELGDDSKALITAGMAAQRFAQGMGLLDIFTKIWIENPMLAKQAGRKVEEFILPLEEVQRRHTSDPFYLEKL